VLLCVTARFCAAGSSGWGDPSIAIKMDGSQSTAIMLRRLEQVNSSWLIGLCIGLAVC